MNTFSFADNIPTCLQERPQWVVWKLVQVPGRPKATKVPFDANTGREASSTDPVTWTTFEAALAYYRSHPEISGIGFVFTEADPYCGIDLDDCLTEGRVSPEAQAIIDDFASYTEISPSGMGGKIFIEGRKPAGAKCQKQQVEGMARIEIYDHARFFTVTGQRFDSTPTSVMPRQEQLQQFCTWLWPPKAVDSNSELLGNLAKFHSLPTGGQLAHCANRLSLDMPSRERRCLAYLQQCPDAISGQGGHDSTLRAACECFRFGLDEAAVWRVIQQFNTQKTGGEIWTDKELAHKIESARKKVEADGEVGMRLAEGRPHLPSPSNPTPAISSTSSRPTRKCVPL